MKSSKNPFDVMVKTLLYIVPEACPDCGGVMHAWRAKNKDGTDRCPPVCMSCGIKHVKKFKD